MASVNRCIFIGNLGADPEVRQTTSGKPVANFRIACTERRKDGEHTEWVSIVAWEKTAEIVGQYLKKGKQVYVEGRLQTREYEKDGVKHYRTEVVCDRMVMLGGPRTEDEHPGVAKAREAFAKGKKDDLPF